MPSSHPNGPLRELLSALSGEKHREESTMSDNQEGQEEESRKTDASAGETTMSDLKKIVAHLKKRDWAYSVDEDRALVRTQYNGVNGICPVVMDLKEEDQILIVYVICHTRVPSERRLEIAEFITRANYGIMIGNFEMDFADGEIRYKASIEYVGGKLVEKMIDELIGKSAFTMNRYLPGIMKVIYDGSITAKAAIAEIEPRQSAGDAVAVAVAELLQVITSGGTSGEDTVEMPAVDISEESTPSSNTEASVVVLGDTSPEEE